jgi:hypothetical protein
MIKKDTNQEIKLGNKYNLIKLKCDCGCKSEVQMMIDKDCNDLQIDCRDDGRHKWHGVWITSEKRKMIKRFLSGKGGEKE